jgi:hypothetical protein
LKELQNAVRRAVHSKYPGIKIEENKKKAEFEIFLNSLVK